MEKKKDMTREVRRGINEKKRVRGRLMRNLECR